MDDRFHPKEGKQNRTVEELEKMLELIDMEIVRSGENIPQKRLEELTIRKTSLAKEVAKLKGESISNGRDSFD